MQAGNAAIPAFVLGPDSDDEDNGMPGDNNFELVNAGTNIMTAYLMCQQVRLRNPTAAARFTGLTQPTGELISFRYTTENPRQTLSFFDPADGLDRITVLAFPTNVFQEKILPGVLCFRAQATAGGFLDPPANTIPFANFVFNDIPGSDPFFSFTVTGHANIAGATRILVTNFAFS